VEDEYTQVQSFDEQADDYITKPFSMVLLGKTGHGVSAEKRAKQPAGYDDVRGCNRRLFRIYSLGSKMKSVCWPAISTVYIKTC
jgi:PleD family two-component response regulator